MKDHQLTKPRSLTNRAQSLDLTFSLTRISEAPRSGLSRPESPDTSVTGTGTNGTSSPTSATVPLFPSVYGPPGTGRTAISGTLIGNGAAHGTTRPGMGYEEDPVDDVSRVISNLGL